MRTRDGLWHFIAMKKILELLIMVPLGLIAVVFMIANRESVAVSFNPFNDGSGFLTSIPLPLWGWFMIMVAIGMVLGMLGMWSQGATKRQRHREMRQELKTLRQQLAVRNEASTDGETLPVLKSE